MGPKHKRYYLWATLIFIGLFVFFVFISRGARDTKLERILSKSLVDFRNGNAEYLDLRTILGNKWEEVCIQGCYEVKDHFEKKIGRKVQGSDPSGDDSVYVLWIFYRDGTNRWVKIPRLKVMDYYSEKGTSCAKYDNPYLYAADSKGTRKYYFLSGKN